MKPFTKLLILIVLFISISIIYIIGIIDDVKAELNTVKLSSESLLTDIEYIEDLLNELPYDEKILNLNEKIDELKTKIESINKEEPTSKLEPTITATTKPTPTISKIHLDKDNDGIYDDIANEYFGRLYIPELNINVALYYSHERFVTDRIDSANIFMVGLGPGYIIADHNNQEFFKLLQVNIGMTGYIVHRYSFSGISHIKCIDVFYGHNTGKALIYENGESAMNKAEYTMYTCRQNSYNVLICLWNVTRTEYNV